MSQSTGTQNPRNATLYRYHSKNNLTLQEAIAYGGQDLEGAIALLYSPEACSITQLQGDQLLNSKGQVPKDIAHVFEARIFNEQCELRWLNQFLGQGQAVFLSEQNLALNNFQAHHPLEIEALEQQYLLWGEKFDREHKTQGWVSLAEARIGRIDIPFFGEMTQDYLYLKTCEYLAAEDQFGNYNIIEERLLGLEAK